MAAMPLPRCHGRARLGQSKRDRGREKRRKEEISSLAAGHPDPHFSLEVPLPKGRGEDTGETRGSGEEDYGGNMDW